MLKVFLSYSLADIEIANVIRERLEDAGMKVFYDDTIKVSENWRDAIINGILEADIGLLLLSPASIQSPAVRTEVLKINAQNKRLYAALVSELNSMELPKFLDGIQYVDLKSSLDNIDSLILAMKNLEDVKDELGTKIHLDLNTYTLTFRADNPNTLKDVIEKLSQSGIEGVKIQKAHES